MFVSHTGYSMRGSALSVFFSAATVTFHGDSSSVMLLMDFSNLVSIVLRCHSGVQWHMHDVFEVLILGASVRGNLTVWSSTPAYGPSG